MRKPEIDKKTKEPLEAQGALGVSARLATLPHPLSAIFPVIFGASAASAFAVFHRLGNGILAIAPCIWPCRLGCVDQARDSLHDASRRPSETATPMAAQRPEAGVFRMACNLPRTSAATTGCGGTRVVDNALAYLAVLRREYEGSYRPVDAQLPPRSGRGPLQPVDLHVLGSGLIR